LERLVRRQTSPQRLVWRASVVLAAAGPPAVKNEHLAQRLHLTRRTVARWRQRWAAAQPALAGVEAAGSDDRELTELVLQLLADEPRPGAPGVFTPEQIVQIVALACEEVAASERPVSHWTPRELADEAVKRGIVERISPRSVGRFLKSGRPQAPPEPVLAER
jgi:putative transposase